MLTSGPVFFALGDLFLVSVSSLDLGDYDDCVLSASLACSAAVFTGNDCWYWDWNIGMSW